MNLSNYLFHLLSAIFYLFHTLPQALYLFHFLKKIFFLSTKLDTKLGLVLMCGLRIRAKQAQNKFKRHLMMPSEVKQKLF